MARRGLCVHLAYLFGEVPFLDRFKAAADAGFAAVEFSDPLRFPAQDLAAAMRRANLTAVQITTSMFNTPQRKQLGLAAMAGREPEFRQDCEALLPYVEALGVRWVHVMAGIVEAGVPFEVSYRTYLDNIAVALRILTPHGVGVLIEPINVVDVPGYFIGDIAIARQALRDLGGADAALMFDAYHIAMDGRDPAETLRESFADVGHIQIADAPGRHEPLSGSIDFPRLFATMDDLGYDGWVSCEYFPAGDTRDGLSWRSRLRSKSVALAS